MTHEAHVIPSTGIVTVVFDTPAGAMQPYRVHGPVLEDLREVVVRGILHDRPATGGLTLFATTGNLI